MHGEIVPVLELGSRLGLPARARGADAELILARTSRRVVAVAADETPSVLPARPSALAPACGRVAGIAAVPDVVLVIHDLDAFLSGGDEELLDRALAEAAS